MGASMEGHLRRQGGSAGFPCNSVWVYKNLEGGKVQQALSYELTAEGGHQLHAMLGEIATIGQASIERAPVAI